MGKDLQGNELGKGLVQRADGRYVGRAMFKGNPILLYSWDLEQLKVDLDEEKNRLKAEVLERELAESRKALKIKDATTLTLSEWFEEWYQKYKVPVLKNGDTPGYKRKFTNYFGVRIGSKFLCELKPIHIQDAIADMIECGRTGKSIDDATGLLRQCIEGAIANGYMTTNPAYGAVVPKVEYAERRVLTTEEQEIFLNYLKEQKHWFEEMFQIMLLTGMRIGEIGGLWWEDIDFDNKLINVNRALSCQYVNGKKIQILTSTKTVNSVRQIPFFGETEQILLKQKEKIKKQRKKYGTRWRQEKELGDLVFMTSLGSPAGRHAVENSMRKITEKINLINLIEAEKNGTEYTKLEGIHPHALRHTFATRCFEKGMSPRTVQDIMGHANYATTVSYIHVLQEIKLKEASRVGNFLDNSNNRTLKIDYDNMIGVI